MRIITDWIKAYSGKEQESAWSGSGVRSPNWVGGG